jgi:hypothetical protein
MEKLPRELVVSVTGVGAAGLVSFLARDVKDLTL